jgi:FixJ family two-component response regulator
MVREPRLTLREWSVAERIAKGMGRDEIAEELGLQPSTIRGVVRRLCNFYSCTAAELPGRIGMRGLGEPDA